MPIPHWWVVPRASGLSARLKLALSYAAFVILNGGVLLAIVWVFLLRYVPDGHIEPSSGFVPNRGDLLRAFAPNAALALGFLVVVGVAGGWWLVVGWPYACASGADLRCRETRWPRIALAPDRTAGKLR